MTRAACLAVRIFIGVALLLTWALGGSRAHAGFVGKNGSIVFSGRTSTGKLDIWTISPDGRGRKDLTTGNSLRDRSPAVSPEGAVHIAWVASRAGCRGGCPGDIWIMNSRGKRRFNATRTADRDEESPTWAPSGGVVAFSRRPARRGHSDIWSMLWTGASPKRLTWTSANDIEPAFSPIDRRIAFASDRSGSYGIYTIDPGGNDVRRLAKHGRSPDWKPEGTAIAFARGGDVWTMRKDGTHQRQLTRGGKDSDPAYSPNGKRIAFRRGAAVMTITTAGGGLRRVTGSSFSASAPNWRPMCTRRGTDGSNRLVGTNASELFCPGRGNDMVLAEGGSDRVYAGAGTDTVYGGPGRDFIEGGMGSYKDVLYGGGAGDYVMANKGNDTVVGGSGSDFLLGGPGNDTVLGRDGVYGNDWEVGASAADTCSADLRTKSDRREDKVVSCEHLIR
jgi:Ca2+-binding RTX toxin-like protein